MRKEAGTGKQAEKRQCNPASWQLGEVAWRCWPFSRAFVVLLLVLVTGVTSKENGVPLGAEFLEFLPRNSV